MSRAGDDQRGGHREQQPADRPLDGLVRAQARPELVTPGEPPERVGARVGPLGRRDEKNQGEHPVERPLEPAHLDDEAPQEPDVGDHEHRPGDRRHRAPGPPELDALDDEAAISTPTNVSKGHARMLTGSLGS